MSVQIRRLLKFVCVFSMAYALISVRWSQAQTAPSVSAHVLERAKADVNVLTSDSLMGRGYLFEGHTRAAHYIRGRFKQLGLQPVDDTYLQPFPVVVDVFPDTPALSVDGQALELGQDFVPYLYSGSGESSGTHRIVRAGSGVVLPEHSIDAYAGLDGDLRDAVVVLDAVVPDSVRALVPEAPELLSTETRTMRAVQRGAEAVLFLADQLMFGASPLNAPVPVFQVLRESWPEYARASSYSVRSVQDTIVQSQNVLGWLPGAVSPDSFIVLMAHYDHHGAIGENFYFPGANDNASGVALLLALAEYLTGNPLRYSVLFAAFSGEEVGLVGSRYFSEHPPVELDRAKFLLNFDMVASGEAGVMAVGGEDFQELFADLSEVNASLGDVPLSKRRNAPNSDHYFLIQRGIPGFFLYTNRGTQPYHHAGDRPETLEWDDFLHVFELSRGFLEQQAGVH